MADLVKSRPAGPYEDNGATVTFTASDTLDQTCVFKEGDVLVAWNSGASTRTVTVYSAPTESRRTDDITAENILAGEHRIYKLTRKGWRQSTGKLKFKASHADVKFAILTGL